MNPVAFNSESSPSVVLDLIFKLKVKDVMTKDVVTATPGSSLRTIQRLMKETCITGVPIVTGKRLIGIVSIDDILTALDFGYIEDPAEKHMSRKLIVLEDDMPLSFAISYMEKYTFGRFPVLNKARELVGIISSRDINMNLLIEINREIEELEKQLEHVGYSDGADIHRVFRVQRYNFETAGKASTEIKKMLKKRDYPSKFIRKAATAAYELEMNQVVHSHGGTIEFFLQSDMVKIIARDRGPGIEDIDRALEMGFSTANEWVRSLGFGAGMGLPNTQRVSDKFDIASSKGGGTTVTAEINLKPSINSENSGEQSNEMQ